MFSAHIASNGTIQKVYKIIFKRLLCQKILASSSSKKFNDVLITMYLHKTTYLFECLFSSRRIINRGQKFIENSFSDDTPLLLSLSKIKKPIKTFFFLQFFLQFLLLWLLGTQLLTLTHCIIILSIIYLPKYVSYFFLHVSSVHVSPFEWHINNDVSD